MIAVAVAVASKDSNHHRAVLDRGCVNRRSETVIDRTAKVLTPSETVRRSRLTLPRDIIARARFGSGGARAYVVFRTGCVGACGWVTGRARADCAHEPHHLSGHYGIALRRIHV